MFQKNKTYFLLTAALIIWGLIGYKIYQHIKPEKKTNEIAFNSSQHKNEKRKMKSNYQLHSGYRDPFLGSIKKNENEIHLQNSSKKASNQINSKEKQESSIFSITYKGMVNPKAHESESVFMIEINGKNELFKIKETIQNVTLLSGNKEKIKIKYNNKVSEIPIKL